MKISHTILLFLVAGGIAACSGRGGGAEAEETQQASETTQEQAMTEETSSEAEAMEIAPGLNATILKKGYGRAAESGDFVEVHYTGWFYDEQAAGKRGGKFDSSVDRGEKFHFKLGAGQVIKGWDQGVEGMLIGEKRELVIAPALAYGERGYPGAIPPNSTLMFEIELFGAESDTTQ